MPLPDLQGTEYRFTCQMKIDGILGVIRRLTEPVPGQTGGAAGSGWDPALVSENFEILETSL
jgi:hypothetical protein